MNRTYVTIVGSNVPLYIASTSMTDEGLDRDEEFAFDDGSWLLRIADDRKRR